MLLLLLLLTIVDAHYQLTNVISFHVPQTSNTIRHTALLSQPQPLGDLSCFIEFSTNPRAINRVLRDDTVEVSPEKKVDGWKEFVYLVTHLGYCLEMKPSGYWSYEICFDRAVRQFHDSEIYNLGIFKEVDNDRLELIFDNGSPCEAQVNKTPRTLRVKPQCDPMATIQAVKVEEAQVCSYVLYVATNKVCGDERFPMVSRKSEDSEDGDGDGSEEWVLSLSRTQGGGFLCQTFVHSHIHDVVFEAAQLSIAFVNSAIASQYQCSYSARTNGRSPALSSEFMLDGSTVKSSPRFATRLLMLSLHCLPK